MEHTLMIKALQVNGQDDPALTDSPALRLCLSVEGPARTMEAVLFHDGTRLWASGPMAWQPCSSLGALPLEPCSAYLLMVRVAGDGCFAEASISLYTGLMGQPWQARWIQPEQEPAVPERPIQFFEQFTPMPDHLGGHDRLRPVQELQRRFSLEEAPTQALLYASAQGVYSLWCNGQRVDDRRLAPETTPYPALTYYQAYDLTRLLRQGENTLRVLLADGWWAGRIGLTGDSCQYGGHLAFLGQLELRYRDGHRDRLVTDEAFEARPSEIQYADLFMGEKWDLTMLPQPWVPCRVLDVPTGPMTVQPIPPIRPWTVLEPAALTGTPKGELVADFGQCLAGVVELRLICPRGTLVTLDHSETLDSQGNFFRNILGRNKDQQDQVVCGEGETLFCPEFTYHGFRYVRITGAVRSQVAAIRALVLGTPLRETGYFSCSDERLNQLQHNIRWSTRSNMCSVPTDCPQREKQGWTGDILAFAPTGCFNYDLKGFLEAWLGQMRLEQDADGGIPIVVPSYPAQTAMQTKTFGGNTSAAWSDACVLVPLALYRSYGDPGVLRDNLDMMERWLGFIQRAAAVPPEDYGSRDAAGKARCPYLWTSGYHFGDWLIPSYQDDIMGGTAVTAPVISACQYAVTVRAYLEVLEALEAPREKISSCQALLANIRRAIREEFVHPDGTVSGDLQGLYVMVLYAGAVEGPLAEKAAARLVQLISENGGCLDTGFVSVPHLLDMLTAHGHKDTAWQLLFQTRSPSWLYQVEHGATTIWENWNAIRPDGTVTTSSFNHYALGCVGDWIYRNIGGLRCLEAGWRAIEYAPDLSCGLDWAQCSHRTPYGLAACCWTRGESGTEIEVTVPWGVRAWLNIPGMEQPLPPGVHRFLL